MQEADPRAQRVLIITLDGARPDALAIADTPVIDRLWQQGAHTWQAQTVEPSVTLPTHCSLFYGTTPAEHGVLSNSWPDPYVQPIPSLLELCHNHGMSTAAVCGWPPFATLVPSGIVDFTDLTHEYEKDAIATGHGAVELIRAHAPAAMFLYLAQPDTDGHAFGWMSDEYIRAIELCDQATGMALEAIEANGDLAQTVIAVLADHGGHEHKHGTDMPEDMTIPWILNGPGVCRGVEVTAPVVIHDTAPTLATVLGLPIPEQWSGRVVDEALCR